MLRATIPTTPFASIIVPCFDCEKTLGSLFHSFRELNNANVEIIFVDNGSRDGTSKLLKKFCAEPSKMSLKHVYFDKECGPGSARQYGLEVALGEYIFFVDSDDQIDARCLSALRRILAHIYYNMRGWNIGNLF